MFRNKWLKVWLAIIGVALTIALVLALVPFGVGINTDGLLSISLSQVGANPDWLTGWSYRQAINITGEAGAGVNYTVKFHVGESSGASGEDFDLNSHCTDFPNDITFTDNDETTELAHWPTNVIGATPNRLATFYVRVADNLTSNQTIYCYYGESGQASSGNDSATFIVGADFDDGSTTGLTLNTAGSGTLTVENPTQIFDELRVDYGYKAYHNPVITKGAATTWNDEQVRELGIILDANNRIVIESGNMTAYCCGYDGTYWAVGRWTSPDGGETWSEYGSNPVLERSAVSGRFDENGVTSPCCLYLPNVGPNTSAPYKLFYHGRYAADAHFSLGFAESVNGINFTRYDGANADKSPTGLRYDDYNDGSSNCTFLAVPWAIKYGNKVLLLFEGQTGSSDFKVYAALSGESDGQPDLSTWAPINQNGSGQGQPILTVGAGGTWDDVGVANPKLIYLGSDKFIMAYNGKPDVSGWKVGFAYSTTAPASWTTATWTKHATNPIVELGMAGRWDDYNCETAGMAIDDIESGASYFRFWYQGYADGNSPQIGLFVIPQGRILHGEVTAAVADGWIAGHTQTAGNYLWELLVGDNFDDITDAYYHQIGIIDASSVPSPEAAATWNARLRFYCLKGTRTYAESCKYRITYQDTGSVYHHWDGDSWETTVTWFGGEGLMKVKMWDDGTNFKCDIVNAITGVSILPNVATIAKSSVKAFSNGTVLYAGEPLSSHYYSGFELDNWIVRKFVDPEPAFSAVGSEEIEEECSPNYYVSPTSWNVNGGSPVAENSNYSTGLTYFTVTNNSSGGAVDISIGGIDMTGGGYTWDLADDGSPGDMIYGLYAGLSGDSYNIIVKESVPYNTLVSNLANDASQSFGLKLYTPTNFNDGNNKSGGITLTVVCS